MLAVHIVSALQLKDISLSFLVSGHIDVVGVNWSRMIIRLIGYLVCLMAELVDGYSIKV